MLFIILKLRLQIKACKTSWTIHSFLPKVPLFENSQRYTKWRRDTNLFCEKIVDTNII